MIKRNVLCENIFNSISKFSFCFYKLLRVIKKKSPRHSAEKVNKEKESIECDEKRVV